jgi:hypothetical protein
MGLAKTFWEGIGYQDENVKKLATFLKNDYKSKQKLQYMVLLDLPSEENIWQRSMYLSSRSSGLALTPEDLFSSLNNYI